MKEFPKLYKRTKMGKIQEWKIAVFQNTDYITSDIMTIQGQLDGKKQDYRETIRCGKNVGKKNETTPYQQACLEAESRWKKKKDEGYKSLEDLRIVNKGSNYYVGDGLPMSFEIALEKALPKFNTDASGNRKPMLAQKFEDHQGKVKFPCYAQPKINGVRCLAFIEEIQEGLFTNRQVTLLSRDGKKYKLDHIQKALIDLIDSISNESGNDYRDIVFDGELYIHETPLNQIVSAVRNNDFRVKYYIYDLAVEDVDQGNRLEFIDKYIKGTYIRKVDTILIDSEERIIDLHTLFLHNGYEGTMLRDPSSFYAFGSRSKSLLKVKSWKEEDFEIVGYDLGKRGVQDLKFICKAPNGKTFDPVATGTINEKQELFNKIDSLIGKKATVKFFEYTEYGIPFHGHVTVIRDYE